MARVLLVDDEPSILSVLNTLLKVEGYDVVMTQEGEKAVEMIKSEEFDLMISDIRMVPISGMELLKHARESQPSMAVIMVTAFGSVETAVEAVKMGAYDYITKPFKIDELLITVQRALEYTRALSENVDLKAQVGALYKFEGLVAESAAMRNVCEMVQHVAPTDTTVLICGEPGTGRRLVAKTLHDRSRRHEGEFVAVDCSKLDDETLSGKLFGREGGEEGAFELASGGTLYLAEIGDMSLATQEKLLHSLEEREITRIGGAEQLEVNVRVLAGTHRNLQEAIAGGTFREDLYYRLNVIPIEIRPLRERTEDILPLAYHILLEEMGGDHSKMPALEPKVRELIMKYRWPGNVGELADILKKATAGAKGNRLTIQDLPPEMVESASRERGNAAADDDYRGKSLRAFLKSKEKEYVKQVLDHSAGDKGKAAKALNISLATLYRKLPEKEEGSES